MIELHIVRPELPHEGYATRFGDQLGIDVDVELDEPWFTVPSTIGRAVPNYDGEPEPALHLEAFSQAPVRSLVAGRAEARDPGLDDHGPPPLVAVRGGRGVEVAISSGNFQLIYSHLRRGSGRTGPIKVGDAIGEPGNTGRCLNGARRSFVKISARSRSAWVRIEQFAEPWRVEATLNGKPLGAPTRIPPGEMSLKGLRLERVTVTQEKPELFRHGDNELEVTVRRGSRILARAGRMVLIEYG